MGCIGFIWCGGSYKTARELGEQLLNLAQGQQDPVLLVAAHRAMGATLYSWGSLPQPRLTLSRALPFMILSTTARMSYFTARTRAWLPVL